MISDFISESKSGGTVVLEHDVYILTKNNTAFRCTSEDREILAKDPKTPANVPA